MKAAHEAIIRFDFCVFPTLTSLAFLFLTSSVLQGQEMPTAPAGLPQVVIDGGQSDLENSRNFIAGKLIVGRRTIADSGLQSVGEILRREPAVTVGKDGRVGLMGLPGHTQILIDGIPSTIGDPFALDLIQVEKIEIIKSATAATGPFGIAGTINIIRRKLAPTRFSQLNGGITSQGGRDGANLGWMSNQASATSPLSANISVSASSATKLASDVYETTSFAGGGPEYLHGARTTSVTSAYLLATADMQWKMRPGQSLRVSPELGRVDVTQSTTDFRRDDESDELAFVSDGKDSLSSFSLPVHWSWRTENDSQIDLKMNRNHAATLSRSKQTLRQPSNDTVATQADSDIEATTNFLNATVRTSFDGGHDVEIGSLVSDNVNETLYAATIGGRRDDSLALLGDRSTERKKSYRLFAQDEWRLNRNLALSAGLSAEKQYVDIEEKLGRTTRSFLLLAPSFHALMKIAGNSKRQLRLSLAQTFQMPTLNQLKLRPRINQLAPCDSLTCVPNSVDSADSAGNPRLAPERAIGINLAYTHGLSENSEVAVEWYQRHIRDKVGNEIFRESVVWSDQARYVNRPANLGDATISGIDLTTRIAAADFWQTSPKLEMNGSVGIASSRLTNLPGPDNRLSGQTPWHAKVGLSYATASWPLKIALDGNVLPGDWVRNNATQKTYQSRRSSLNANANWKLSDGVRLSFSCENLFSSDAARIDDYSAPELTLRQTTVSSSYRRFGLRLEIKL